MTWNEDERKVVKNAVKQSRVKPVKELVAEIAETLNRSEQSIRNRFYLEKKELEEDHGLRFDRRKVSEKGESQANGIVQSLEYLENDLQELETALSEIREHLLTTKKQAQVLETWAKDTLEIKKQLTATVESNGVVQKIHSNS